MFLATAARFDSADETISAATAASPSASTPPSPTSSDVFFIHAPAPAALESPRVRAPEPAAVPVGSASATSALGQPLRRQQTVDAVFGQLTDRLSYARSRASRLRATEEVWDLALAELFAPRPPDA